MRTSYVHTRAAAVGAATISRPGQFTVEWLQAILVSSGNAGNRQIVIDVLDAENNVLATLPAGLVQAASLTRSYTAAPELTSGTSFISNDVAIALPRIVVPASGTFRVRDSAAIHAAGDTIALNAGITAY